MISDFLKELSILHRKEMSVQRGIKIPKDKCYDGRQNNREGRLGGMRRGSTEEVMIKLDLGRQRI